VFEEDRASKPGSGVTGVSGAQRKGLTRQTTNYSGLNRAAKAFLNPNC